MEIQAPWIEKHQEIHYLEVCFVDDDGRTEKESFRINIYGDFYGIEINNDEGKWEIYNEANSPYLKGMHNFLKDKIQAMVYDPKNPVSKPQDIREPRIF